MGLLISSKKPTSLSPTSFFFWTEGLSALAGMRTMQSEAQKKNITAAKKKGAMYPSF
jgi:hypothetical protein